MGFAVRLLDADRAVRRAPLARDGRRGQRVGAPGAAGRREDRLRPDRRRGSPGAPPAVRSAGASTGATREVRGRSTARGSGGEIASSRGARLAIWCVRRGSCCADSPRATRAHRDGSWGGHRAAARDSRGAAQLGSAGRRKRTAARGPRSPAFTVSSSSSIYLSRFMWVATAWTVGDAAGKHRSSGQKSAGRRPSRQGSDQVWCSDQ